MAPKSALIILVLGWVMVLDHYVVTGYKTSAEEDDQELERQLNLLSKPAVATIQTTYGDSYDCVDFYLQPAFDHPLLKNHKNDYKLNRETNNDTYDFDPSDIWLNGKGCPINTVPIKRITKQDLIGANMAAEVAYNNSLNLNPGVEVAVLKTTRQNKYYGGGMAVSVYHPAVQSTQYSSTHIKFQNGPDSISVGWTVNPSLYPDGETRLFIYTITKNSHCYNTFCPGFVILSPNVPVDLLLKPYSKIGGPSYETNLFVRKRATNGDWFLAIGNGYIPVGFWPQRIFTGLADSANYVEWGGEVYSPPGTSPPPMGAGHLPSRKLFENCYGRQVTLIGENHEIDHNPPSCVPYSNSKGYQLIDVGVVRSPYDRVIVFGGNI